MLDIELMLASRFATPTLLGRIIVLLSGLEIDTLAVMDYPTSFMKKWGKKDHLKHCSIAVYLVVLKRDRIAFRGKNFYIKGKSTFRAFCKIEEPAAVCISLLLLIPF